MNENNLYYKRGMYIIDKLLKTFSNDTRFYKERLEFTKTQLNRMATNKKLVNKDINSLYITCLTALLGLNKENIESINKHNNYDLSDVNGIRDMGVLNDIKKTYPEFDNDRKIQTKFDKWLSVERCDYPTNCYMMNIRNGLLHGECEPLGEYGDLLSIKNSNYMKFNSKVILLGLLDFCELYFGNSGWLGLSENLNIYNMESNSLIKNTKDLDEVLDTIGINEITYKYKGKDSQFKLPELILYEELYKNKNCADFDKLMKKLFGKKYDYLVTKKALTLEQKEIVKKMIEKYFGDEFYKMSLEDQKYPIMLVTRYLCDSRMVISEWICDYIELMNYIENIYYTALKNKKEAARMIDEYDFELNHRSIFASRTSLLIIKLYHVLYRMQYKNYEEVDYSMIDFDMASNDYSYTRIEKNGSATYDFNIDKAKMISKYPNETSKEIENRIICEIVRDALCHGNVEINFKIENDELAEYVVLEDKYKGKNRKLEVTLDKLEKFINSNAFKVENCIVKENTQKVIR